VALLASGCGGSPVPELRPRDGVFHVAAGQRYLLTYATPVDDAPVGTTWLGSSLAGSPLAAMARPALVLKADDFGPAFESIPIRFVEAVDAARGVASLGIITGRLTHDSQQLEAYRTLHAAGFELWFHGHRHRYRGPHAEFMGELTQVQRAVFDHGLAVGRDVLGLEFHSFGAPGNGVDENTAAALRQEPRIKVWLLGIPGLGVYVLGGAVSGEESEGVARDPLEIYQDLEKRRLGESPPDAVPVQVHPRDWSEESLDRFVELVGLVAAGGAWRFSGPYDEWCWLQDRGTLVVSKAGGAAYELDLRAVEHDLRLDLDPAVGPLPASVQPLD
jgi:hypothetical protein